MRKQAALMETSMVRADSAGIARAIDLLSQGQVVALPTETVYGLAADATNGEAVARIYAAKGRPSFNPLIAHVSDEAMASDLIHMTPLAHTLARAFWPGPLTLVLPLRADSPIASLVTAGLPTLAVRCPNHPIPQAIIKGLGRPLAAPSANPSGRISATRAEHVLSGLKGRLPLILDGGPTQSGLESTIVALDAEIIQLLRPGPITKEQLSAFGPVEEAKEGVALQAPGQLASHYAPHQPVRLNVSHAKKDEFFIGFNKIDGNINLSSSGDLTEAAARLFEALHQAEVSGAARIAIAPIPHDGLGAAINDRLTRAAAPRPRY